VNWKQYRSQMLSPTPGEGNRWNTEAWRSGTVRESGCVRGQLSNTQRKKKGGGRGNGERGREKRMGVRGKVRRGVGKGGGVR